MSEYPNADHLVNGRNPFGLWSPGVDPVERGAQLRALAAAHLGSSHPLIAELRAAEIDGEAAARALELLVSHAAPDAFNI
jgi:hypothetical protein